MKIGRNDPCPCGSGKKYKKCCMGKEETLSAPKSPLEKINESMQKGYDFAKADLFIDACDEWWETWQRTLSWLNNEEITSIDKLSEITSKQTSDSFYNWVQDFEMALENVSLKDAIYLQMRFDFTSQFQEHFPDSDRLIMLNMGTAAAESLFLMGQKDEADAWFEKVVSEHPANPWALIRWGDMYTTWMKKDTANHDRARELYEQALDVAKEPMDREDIQDRIKDLKR